MEPSWTSSSTHSPNALRLAAFDPHDHSTPIAISFGPFRTSARVRTRSHASRGIVTDDRWDVSRSVLSDAFSEGKLKDLRGPFPSDQPTELDGHDFFDDGDLEYVEDDAKLTTKLPETSSESPKPQLKSPVFGSGFTSSFSPQVSRPGSMSGISSVCHTTTRSADLPGTHLGKVVVLHDVSLVT